MKLQAAVFVAVVLLAAVAHGQASICCNAAAQGDLHGVVIKYNNGGDMYHFEGCQTTLDGCDQGALMCQTGTDGKKYSIGSATGATLGPGTGAKSVLLTGPEMKSTADNGNFKRGLKLTVTCGQAASTSIVSAPGPPADGGFYEITHMTTDPGICQFAGCGGGDGGDGDDGFVFPFSGGWLFFMICLPCTCLGVFLYLVIGVVIKIKVYEVPYQPVSPELIPNISFWKAWPFMIFEAHKFIVLGIKAGIIKLVAMIKGMKKGESYEEM